MLEAAARYSPGTSIEAASFGGATNHGAVGEINDWDVPSCSPMRTTSKLIF
jgi:hypothetical protein